MEDQIDVLIADGNENYTKLLQQALRQAGCRVVGVAADGSQASQALLATRPDVLVLDLSLRELDGMAVLKQAAGMEKRPAVIVTTNFVTNHVAAVVASASVQRLMLKPCDPLAVVERIRKLQEERLPAASEQDRAAIEAMVTATLHEIGVPAHIKGCQYLREAILIAAEDRNAIGAIPELLYPQVAKAFATTPSRVERAIRHAIDVAWDRADRETLQRHFGHPITDAAGKPTNAEFIALIADKLQQQLKNPYSRLE